LPVLSGDEKYYFARLRDKLPPHPILRPEPYMAQEKELEVKTFKSLFSSLLKGKNCRKDFGIIHKD